jgi:superfamily II DNA or RNA helicase
MQLRDYQQGTIDKIKTAWSGGTNRLIAKYATGLGKTPLFAALPDELAVKGRMLVVVHRDELAQQAADKLRKWNPARTVGIEMGDQRCCGADLVVGGVQTLGRSGGKLRLAELDPSAFGAVVIDECHHSTSDSYRRIFEHFNVFDNKDILSLGVTATVNRADGTGLGEVYQEIVDDKDILFGIRNGWLVDLKGIRVKTSTDLNDVHTKGHDFDQRELVGAVNTYARNDQAVRAWLEHGESRQTVGYCVDVQHAKDVADTFRRYGVVAEAVWGMDPYRKEKLTAHRDGKIQVLLNCEVLTEGYDDWRIGCVMMLRPTKSEGLYTQIVGRGTRIPDGIGNLRDAINSGKDVEKRDCILLDLVDVTNRHSLVSLPTLFGMNQDMDLAGKSILEVVDEIEEIKFSKPFVDITKVLNANDLKTYAEQVDLFRVELAPEVLQWSEYCWQKSGNDAYVLLLPDKENVVVLKDMLDQWHIVGKVRGVELRDVKPDFGTALREADYQVKLHGGRNVNALVNRNSGWRTKPPTELQLAMCRRFGVKVPAGATRGEVTLKLDWEFKKRAA